MGLLPQNRFFFWVTVKKVGKKVHIHFSEKVVSENNLPLMSGVEPGLNVLAHNSAEMAEAAEFLGDLQLWGLVTVQPFDLQTLY